MNTVPYVWNQCKKIYLGKSWVLTVRWLLNKLHLEWSADRSNNRNVYGDLSLIIISQLDDTLDKTLDKSNSPKLILNSSYWSYICWTSNYNIIPLKLTPFHYRGETITHRHINIFKSSSHNIYLLFISFTPN